MTWRTVVVSSCAKLDLKMGYMVIRAAEVHKVHLSEISVLIIENTTVSVTAMLLCELVRRKIKVIFCDEVHEPYGEIVPYHGSHDSADKLRSQIAWRDLTKDVVWAEIIRRKIRHQADLAEHFNRNRAEMIRSFADDVGPGDPTNREAHAAKVYFNTIFGMDFSRRDSCPVNAHLNYGYAIVLSAVNREISALGYSTQLGIHHGNTYNCFNFGSDLIEPLRPLVDSVVLGLPGEISTDSKHRLADILNTEVRIDGKTQYLVNAIRIYVKSVADALEEDDTSRMRFCEYEGQGYASDRLLRSPHEDRGRLSQLCQISQILDHAGVHNGPGVGLFQDRSQLIGCRGYTQEST